MNRAKRRLNVWTVLSAAAFLALPCAGHADGPQPHWFSGTVGANDQRGPVTPRLFDVTVSLHGDPQGDDDGETQDVDPGSAEQDTYEKIFQYFADGVYESTEGAHKIRRVRVFRNEEQQATVDVVWDASGHPGAKRNGITDAAFHIYMYDDFNGHNLLDDVAGAGYTLAHEWAHYAYGLRDEYLIENTDVAVAPSIMNSQWSARDLSTQMLTDSRWLNFSIAFQGDPGGDFQNTERTAQHRFYEASDWETLSSPLSLLELLNGGSDPVRVVYSDLASVAPTGSDAPSFPDLPGDARSDLEIIWSSDDFVFEIVIDKSGSMTGDKIDNAKTAASLLVDIIETGSTALGVIAFNNSFDEVQPIVDIDDQATKDAVKNAIGAIVAGGGTLIGGAAQEALDRLLVFGDGNDIKATFLLSDGQSADDALAPVPGYIAAQIPVFTIAFGDNADVAVLGELANQTGGILCISPVSLEDITRCFQDALGVFTDQTTVAGGDGSIPPGASEAASILVDPTMATLSVVVTHVGTPADATFVLVAPDTTRTDPLSVSESGGETLTFFEVSGPSAGPWLLEGSAFAGDVAFGYQASARPDGATYTLQSMSVLGDPLQYPDPLIVISALTKERPVANAQVEALVGTPDGGSVVMAMNDEGLAPDVAAGDGVYSGIFAPVLSGTHNVEVFASGTAGVAALTSAGLEPSASPDGTAVPFPPNEPVAADFQRFDRIQVRVENVLADDHGNSPEVATPLGGSNDELLYGNIETPGDVDIFQITLAPEATEIAVRVSGLALGMQPLLRVLASDGLTVIAEGTLENAATGGAYLALIVPVEGEPTVFAEVSHATAGTGIYQVSAGPQLSTDTDLFSARGAKMQAQAILTAMESDDSNIEKALKEIEKSLDEALWLDDDHLTDDGKKVFDFEKKAVDRLSKVDDDADVQEAINLLLSADDRLAFVALDDVIAVAEASGCLPESASPCDKVWKEIGKAEKDIAKALEQLEKGKPKKAIDQYKKAWEHAGKAMERLAEIDPAEALAWR